jgi:glycosyltransferase involved in cell wall biosynthesis
LRIVEKIIAFSYRNRVFLKYSDCEQLGFRDSNVIPNYVDSEKFVPSFDRDVDALVVSRHSQQKMIKKMIDFCVGEKFERVIILGDGPDFQENVAYAEERILGASTKFTFIKYDARPERYFSRAKYYVHFAVSEGMPLAVLEAMASGCIVVLNRFQGAEELIRHSHTGYIVDSVSSTSLPAYDQDVGSRAREVVIESYSVDAFADAYENLISRMIAH